jgi:6,7-dimethyl-8-ribityllumazine synthase
VSDQGSQMGLEPGAAKGLRIAVVTASFNAVYTRRLLASAKGRLRALGLGAAGLHEAWVPGALELPLAAQALARSGRFDAVITLGCVIRGDTSHYDLVCEGAAQGVLQAGLSTGVPVLFGVITCEDKAQALARCSGGPKDSGKHAAEGAVVMARLLRAARQLKKGK